MSSFALPRSGKDITATLWYENGTQQQRILKWNGHGFQLTDSKELISDKNPDDIDYSSGPEYNQNLRSLVNGED